MRTKLKYIVLAVLSLLLLFSGTVAHNIIGLDLNHESRTCLEIGEHALCVTEIKH